MTYPESHEPYTDDSQDAYNTQPVHYTAYGYAPNEQQGMTAQGQPAYQYSSITSPNGGYPPYAQPTYYGYGQPSVPYAPDAQSQRIAYAQPKPVPPPAKKPQQPQAHKVMKRSKAESLSLVSKLKKWIIAASFVSFGTLSFLVAGNVVGVTSHTSSSSSTSTSSKSSTTVTTPSQSSTNNSSGSYFQQGQNQQSQSQSNQGGYGIGNSSSSSQQGAVSSSRTS